MEGFHGTRFQRKVVSNAPDACPCLRDGARGTRVRCHSRGGARCAAWSWRTGRRWPSGHGPSCGADGAAGGTHGAAGSADGAASNAGTTANAADAGAAADAGPAPDAAADAAAQHGRHAGTAAEFPTAEHGRHAEHVASIAAECVREADAADAAAAQHGLTAARPRKHAASWNSWPHSWSGCRWPESTSRSSGQSRWHDPSQPAAGCWSWCWHRWTQSSWRDRWWGSQSPRRRVCQPSGTVLSPARSASQRNRDGWCHDVARHERRCRWSAWTLDSAA